LAVGSVQALDKSVSAEDIASERVFGQKHGYMPVPVSDDAGGRMHTNGIIVRID